MELTKKESKFIDDWIELCENKTRLMEETQAGWEVWVATPVISHNIAPREARALLEIVGLYADKGFDASYLVQKIAVDLDDFLKKHQDQKETSEEEGKENEEENEETNEETSSED